MGFIQKVRYIIATKENMVRYNTGAFRREGITVEFLNLEKPPANANGFELEDRTSHRW